MSQIFVSISLPEFQALLKEIVRTELQNHNKEPPKSNNEFITRQQAAKILQISLPTISDYTNKGRIPAYRIGNKIRYLKSEVEGSLKQIKTINNGKN